MYLMHDTVDDLQALGRKLYEAVNTGDIPYANNGSYCHDRAYAMALKAERAGLPFEMAYFLPGSWSIGTMVSGAGGRLAGKFVFLRPVCSSKGEQGKPCH